MGTELSLVLVGVKTLNLALGGLITYYAYKAYRRTGSASLRAMAVGFGTITIGALLAGSIDRFTVMNDDLSLVVESLFTMVGFVTILYSLHM